MSGPMPAFVWVDGELLPASEPQITVFDRGFQLGDGIFETLRARGGRLTEVAEHVARLRRSAAGLDIDLPADLDERLAEGIAALLAAEDLDGPDADASIRITVTRGAWASRGLLPPRGERLTATIAIQAWPVVPAPAAHLEDGLHLVVSAVRRDPANPIVTLKTTSRADYVFARLEARRAGADDALFLTVSGHISDRRRRTCSSSGGAPMGRRSWRPRRSSARSCPAPRVPGCSRGRAGWACAPSRTG